MEWIWKTRDNERLSIWNGAFANITISVVNGFVGMYLLDGLHATDNEMGLLNALPSFVNLFSMMAAASLIQGARRLKWWCVAVTAVSRSFSVWMALVPWVPIQDKALWVVWLVALTRVPQSAGDLTWQALIAKLIPPDRRSAFFSQRNRLLTVVGLLATLLTGLILQQFDKHALLPYQITFIATVLFALGELWMLILHDESDEMQVELPTARLNTGKRGWRSALADIRFVKTAAALLLFNLGWQLSWPLYSIYQIKTAHSPAIWMSLFLVANSASQFVSYGWWSRLADARGNARVMAIAAFGMATAPVLTVLSTNMVYLFIINLWTGIAVAGTTLLLFNILLEVCPEDSRTRYISYYNVALSVVGFVAPEMGILLLHALGMTAGMVVSAVLRIAGGLAFLWIAKLRLAPAAPADGSTIAR